MGKGSFRVQVAAAGLAFLLAISAIIGFLILQRDTTGGMEDKWVFVNRDSSGNPKGLGPGAFIDSKGNIIAYESNAPERGICCFSPNGSRLWRTVTNAFPSIEEGLDGGYYYIDWNTSDPAAASWSKLTALGADGKLKWNFDVPKGTLELWGVYPDGQVVVHNHDWEYNNSSNSSETILDRVIAISSSGSELWSMDAPLADASWGMASVSDNGTLVVKAGNSDGLFNVGISKDGTQVSIDDAYYLRFFEPSPSSIYDDTAYEVRREYVDNKTSIISVYAVDLQNGSTVWKTVLHNSDNPDHTSPGSYNMAEALVDDEGRIFCGDIVNEHSYSLSQNGTILWEKSSLGSMVDVLPSGGILVWSYSSIKNVNQSDGSVEWRHQVSLDEHSFVLMRSDETVYYSTGSEVHSMAKSSEPDEGSQTFILAILLGLDLVAVAFLAVYILMSGRDRQT